jgi:hypothetical protein
VQQKVQQQGRTTARVHDRRHLWLAAEVLQSLYAPVVCIQKDESMILVCAGLNLAL